MPFHLAAIDACLPGEYNVGALVARVGCWVCEGGSMAYKTILLESEGDIAILTLNRPDRLNAVTSEMQQELKEALEQARRHGSRVLILTGAGRGFCSGADIGRLEAMRGESGSGSGDNPTAGGSAGRLLFDFEMPTIALVNGPAVGMGFSMALACDIRIAGESARFAALFVRRGIAPDTGLTWLLPRMVGLEIAMELMYTGRMVSAQEARELGLVRRVVPDVQLLAEGKAMAQEIAKGPPLALAATKRLAHHSVEGASFHRQADLEAQTYGVLVKSEDHAEGLKAFREKREPVFRGR